MRAPTTWIRRAVRRRARGTLTAAFLVVSTASTGCLALRLSGRGAPDSAMRELTVELDAVDLPAHTGGGAVQDQPAPTWVRLPEAGWLHGWDYSLTDATGQPAPRGTLHHFKVLDPDTRELFSEVMLHVIASGEETTPATLPRELGYRFEEGDSLLVTAMLHNPTGYDLRGVHLTVTLRYSPEGSWQPPLDVVPFFAHVASDWDDVAYDLPPGRSQRSVEIVPPIDVHVIGLGGHLHRYGRSLRLESLPDAQVIWEARAELASDGTVIELPHHRFVWSNGPALRKGRTYRLTAVYDNPTSVRIVGGGMATLGGVVVPEEPWPGVDRDSEEYAWYLARELRGTETRPDR